MSGASLLLNLDMKGIAASSGSACTSGSLDPSHVLLAMGLDHATAHGSLRLSLSGFNRDEEVAEFLTVFPAIWERLRSMSPLYATRDNRLRSAVNRLHARNPNVKSGGHELCIRKKLWTIFPIRVMWAN